MKKKINVVMITSIMFLSVVITANAGFENTISKNIQTENDLDNIVWDNGMSYDEWIYAQWDEYYNFDASPGDDFMFDETTAVNGIHWVGGYAEEGYEYAQFDWAIAFYDDDGSGNSPGYLLDGYLFPHLLCNPIVIEEVVNGIYYHFSTLLPETLVFDGNTKYWVSFFAIGQMNPISFMGIHDSYLLHYGVFGSNWWGIPYWTDMDSDVCFQLSAPEADLVGTGSLSWTKVKPGSIVNGNFELENDGEEGSLLDWEISETPDWGGWIFDPDEGEDLTPEDGVISINVTVIAPDEAKKDFSGHITLINSGDNSDFEIIDVSLSTPKNKSFVFNFPVLNWLFERFPNVFPILRYLVGL